MRNWIEKHKGFLIITIVFIILFLLMLPLRNVSYFDDFAYIQTAEHFIKTGQVKISDWAAVTMIFQIFWSAIFVKIFGFSIAILHLSNIVIVYFGLLAFYQLLRIFKLEEKRAIFFTIILFAFPWVFHLMYSYMSDTFSMSLLIISIYFYTKGIKENKSIYLLLGSLTSGFGFLARQLCVVLPIAILITIVYQSYCKEKILFKELFYSLVPFTILFTIYSIWLDKTGMPAGEYANDYYSIHVQLLPYILPFNLGRVGITNSIYIELFIQRLLGYIENIFGMLLPIFIVYSINIGNISRYIRKNFKLLLVSSLVLIITLHIDDLLKNKFTTTGAGYLTRYDKLFLDWRIWWNRFAILGLPIFILFATESYKNIIKSTTPLEKFNKNKFLLISYFLTTAAALFLFYLITKASYPEIFKVSVYLDPFRYALYVLSHQKEVLDVFVNSWFFFAVIFLPIFYGLYILFKKGIYIDTNINPGIFLMFFVLLGEIFATVVLAHFFWEEYIIQFIPFVIFFVAYMTRKIEINYFRCFLVIILMLLFSLEVTRNRYQEEGAKWELATAFLQQNNINAYYMPEVNWAWKPYWFFQSAFDDAVKKSGKSKYEVAIHRISFWRIEDVIGTTYDFTFDLKDKNIVSGPAKYWIFSPSGVVHKEIYLKLVNSN